MKSIVAIFLTIAVVVAMMPMLNSGLTPEVPLKSEVEESPDEADWVQVHASHSKTRWPDVVPDRLNGQKFEQFGGSLAGGLIPVLQI